MVLIRRKISSNSAQDEDDFAKNSYGSLELNKSQHESGPEIKDICTLTPELDKQECTIRARLESKRIKGNRGFLILRQGKDSLQAVIAVDASTVSKKMLKFCSGIPCESIVLVSGKIAKTQFPISSCTVTDIELKIEKLYLVSQAERLPFDLKDASRPEEEFKKDPKAVHVNLETRLDSRVIDLRTLANQGIFRIQSGVCQFFREYLLQKNFVEIHTPKILSTSSESGSSVFKIGYFKGTAFLAQSPQLYKQMLICSDFERVFEISPVFRAENSQTHRHLTEFTGLDLEMTFKYSYHEVLETIEQLFVYIFDNLKKKFSAELKAIAEQYSSREFKYSQNVLRLKYKDGIEMLRKSGVEIQDCEDLSTENEKKLGELVMQKYNTDFYVLDKFPLEVRPFYTMPCPENDKFSNSYDIYMRGEEVLSGGQRVHDPNMLQDRIAAVGVDPQTMKDYIDAFKYGVLPHAGGGIGLERVVMLYLGLNNVRRTSLFPRDPKRLTP